MDNTKQVKDLREALDLEKRIANLQNQLSRLKAERYAEPPRPPVCETVKRMPYPDITPQTKYDWKIALFPSIIFSPWFIIYYFLVRKKKKQEVEDIRNSEEYKSKCTAIDTEYDRKMDAAQKKYSAEKIEYETVTLPAYQKELEKWKEQQNEKISQIQQELNKTQVDLSGVYQTTKIVPLQYRNIQALQYLYDLISTSDYDVKQAIEIFDRSEQRKLDREKIRKQEEANRLAYKQNQLALEQNDLLDEQNAIAEKARRDANIAAVVGTVQRHNTNKYLKGKK